MVTISVQLPVDVSFYFFPSVGFPVTFLQYGKKVSAEGLLHGGQKPYWGLGSYTRSGRVSQWPAGPKWAARRKVYVTLKMYLSTGKLMSTSGYGLFTTFCRYNPGWVRVRVVLGCGFQHFFRNLVPVRFYSAAINGMHLVIE